MTTTTPRGELTAQQAAVLKFIGDYFAANMRPPSLREMADHFGWSMPTGAVCHVLALRKKGWLVEAKAVRKRQSRGVEIVGMADAIRAAVEDHLRGLLAGE